MKKLTLISCTLGLLISHAVQANETPLQGTLKKIAKGGMTTQAAVTGCCLMTQKSAIVQRSVIPAG